MNYIEMNPLNVTLHKTVRVANDGDCYNLPPDLGPFDIFKVSDFPNCPKSWDKEAYFIAMHSQEAMWISFQTCEPVAVMVGAGKINALDAKPFGEKLEKDNYLVTPPQPWLDGWKNAEGSVYQFVATETGENKTIGEQLAETQEHAILLSVFEAKNPQKLQRPMRNDICCFGVGLECCKSVDSYEAELSNEMGLGKGGKIEQKIYEDPHGIEEWKKSATKTIKVYLINASEFAEVTGQVIAKPVSSDEYHGHWFSLDDKKWVDQNGTSAFDNLKSAT